MNKNIKVIQNKIVVSCQARKGMPGDVVNIQFVNVESAVLAGAEVVRIKGTELIKMVKESFSVVVIGMTKKYSAGAPDSGWVTPTFEDAKSIIDAGADILVIDGSYKLHDDASLSTLINTIRKYNSEIALLVDVGTLDEGVRVGAMGVDAVATTFAQADTRGNGTVSWMKHVNLLEELSKKLSIPVICEGGISEPTQVKEAFSNGAFAVVVGKAITDPFFLTRKFIQH